MLGGLTARESPDCNHGDCQQKTTYSSFIKKISLKVLSLVDRVLVLVVGFVESYWGG